MGIATQVNKPSVKTLSYSKDHADSLRGSHKVPRKLLAVSGSLGSGTGREPVATGSGAVLSESKSEPRGVPRRGYELTTHLGELEYRVLRYVLENNLRYVTIAELAKSLGADNRRIWDSMQRLMRRGIVSKLDRGIYVVDREKASVLVQFYEFRSANRVPKDSDSPRAVRVVAGCDVVRVHARARSGDGPLEFLRYLLYAYYSVRYAVEFVKAWLRSKGFSRHAVKRVISYVVRAVDGFFRSARAVIGMHGFRSVRAAGSDVTYNLGSKEIGIDFISESGSVEKFHVKIYSDRSSEAANRRLTDYLAESLVSLTPI